jgi:hypothetical protein
MLDAARKYLSVRPKLMVDPVWDSYGHGIAFDMGHDSDQGAVISDDDLVKHFKQIMLGERTDTQHKRRLLVCRVCHPCLGLFSYRVIVVNMRQRIHDSCNTQHKPVLPQGNINMSAGEQDFTVTLT